jgi:hypothetical protein
LSQVVHDLREHLTKDRREVVRPTHTS